MLNHSSHDKIYLVKIILRKTHLELIYYETIKFRLKFKLYNKQLTYYMIKYLEKT